MTIIVETGSGDNASANSYADVTGLRDYAELRGADLPVDDADCEVLLIKAMDYLESLAAKYKGHKTKASQPLQWPRADVWGVDRVGELLANNAIPRALEYAQYSLAIEANAVDLQPTRLPTDSGPIVREKVDVSEVEYANEGRLRSTPAFAKADALLSALLTTTGLFLIRS
jgi:hypothetical protein